MRRVSRGWMGWRRSDGKGGQDRPDLARADQYSVSPTRRHGGCDCSTHTCAYTPYVGGWPQPLGRSWSGEEVEHPPLFPQSFFYLAPSSLRTLQCDYNFFIFKNFLSLITYLATCFFIQC
jgi:hypothetical protein